MNKKGQSLIVFIILIPIFLYLVIGIVDLGNIALTKRKALSIGKSILVNGVEEKEINDIIKIYDDNKIIVDNVIIDDAKMDVALEIDGLITSYKTNIVINK